MDAMADEYPSITCPVCKMTSYHPKDIEHGFCGNCHEYTGTPDGCARAYFQKFGMERHEADNFVFKIMGSWFEERTIGDPIIDWLRQQYPEGSVQA
jgi:hypothetical protein